MPVMRGSFGDVRAVLSFARALLIARFSCRARRCARCGRACRAGGATARWAGTRRRARIPRRAGYFRRSRWGISASPGPRSGSTPRPALAVALLSNRVHPSRGRAPRSADPPPAGIAPPKIRAFRPALHAAVRRDSGFDSRSRLQVIICKMAARAVAPRASNPTASLRHVHIIGVCGTLMGAFAAFLKRAGKRVTGSDQNVYPPMSDVLREAGVELLSGYRAENLSARRKARSRRHRQRDSGRRIPRRAPRSTAGYAYSSLPEAMEKLLLKTTRNLVVAGTHGKTTTSSLLAHVLVACGRDPSFFIGGVSHDLPHSFHVGAGGQALRARRRRVRHRVLGQGPQVQSLSARRRDHHLGRVRPRRYLPGFPGGRARVSRARRAHPPRRQADRVLRLRRDQGARARGQGSGDFLRELGARKARASGPGPSATRAGARVSRSWKNGEPVAELSLGIPGAHNVLNALAVWIECRELGLPEGRSRRRARLVPAASSAGRRSAARCAACW